MVDDKNYRMDADIVDISDKEHEYFDEVETKMASVDIEQRAWYISTRDNVYSGESRCPRRRCWRGHWLGSLFFVHGIAGLGRASPIQSADGLDAELLVLRHGKADGVAGHGHAARGFQRASASGHSLDSMGRCHAFVPLQHDAVSHVVHAHITGLEAQLVRGGSGAGCIIEVIDGRQASRLGRRWLR